MHKLVMGTLGSLIAAGIVAAFKWHSIDAWRIIAGVEMVIILAALGFHDRLAKLLLNENYRQHDIAIFRESNQILTARDLADYLYRLDHDECCTPHDVHRRNVFLHFYEQEDNRYLLAHLRRASSKLIRTLDDLRNFSARHFFSHDRGGETWDCLEPALNIDRVRLSEGDTLPSSEDKQRYNQCSEELFRLVRRVREADKHYRRALNQVLPDIR